MALNIGVAFGKDEATLNKAFDLIDWYETNTGPLFAPSTFARSFQEDGKNYERAILAVQQVLIDQVSCFNPNPNCSNPKPHNRLSVVVAVRQTVHLIRTQSRTNTLLMYFIPFPAIVFLLSVCTGFQRRCVEGLQPGGICRQRMEDGRHLPGSGPIRW
jgi:hypothetical protein